MNFRLDVVVSDICGLTGLKIIKAIVGGELNPYSLAKHRHFNCRKSEEEIAKALHGNNREEYLFGLEQEYESYMFFQKKIRQCDEAIKKCIEDYFSSLENPIDDMPVAKPHKRRNKNAPKNIDLNTVSYQFFGGVDLMAIEGVSHATLLTLMSEIGTDGLSKFKTAKQFASWLRLAPNRKISGGKVLSNRTPRGSNRIKIALRNAANSIGNLKDSYLTKFFKKIAYKRGRKTAITATARKLAVIIWNMVTKKQEYNPPEIYLYLDQKRKYEREEATLQKNIDKFPRIGTGFDVHAFGEGAFVTLGGESIPHEKGLIAHSDGDVLLHAIMDALLGALALGDIGKHFPDTDEKWKGANSRDLLKAVNALIQKQGYIVGNVDSTIIAQAPKMAPYIERMQHNIAEDLDVNISCVGVKATTTEKLGFTGRKEGIACQASVLLIPLMLDTNE